MENGSDPEFHDLTELGELVGCTEMQTRLAEGLLAGLSQTDAAYRAKYAGARDSVQLRSAASSASRAKSVMALLALAESHGLGVPSAPGDREELLRILWTHARSKDKPTSIRATIELDRIVKEDMSREDYHDPLQTIRQIAEISPSIAARLAKDQGIPFEMTAEQRTQADGETAEIVRTWIRAHREEARRMLDFNGSALAEPLAIREGTDAVT